MTKTQRILGLGTLACALLTGTAITHSQTATTPPIIIKSGTIELSEALRNPLAPPATQPPGTPGAAAAAATPGAPAGKVETAEDLLVKKFPTLIFDRRQSIILKTWSSPWPIPIPEPDPDEEKERIAIEAKKKAAADKIAADAAKTAEATAKAEDEAAGDDPEKLKALEEKRKKAAEAKAKAEESKAAAKAKADEKLKLAAQVDADLRNFQRDVTLGNWDKVHAFFNDGKVFEDELNAKRMYALFLAKLIATPKGIPAFLKPVVPKKPGAKPTPTPQPQPQPNQQPGGMFVEKNVFLPNDILAIADASPTKLSKKTHPVILGRLLQQSFANGNFLDQLMVKLTGGTRWLGGTDPDSRMMAARVLINANRPIEAGTFLPLIDDAEKNKDVEALNLIALYNLTRYKIKPERKYLETGWKATQSVLATNVLKDDQKDEALQRAVELAPKLEEELGQAWLGESFTKNESRGREVLAAIGAATSKNRGYRMSDPRLKRLELQKTAVDALLSIEGIDMKKWQSSINLLALNWLSEGQYSYQRDGSTSSSGMQMRWDNYGNMYYVQDDSNAGWHTQNRGGAPQPITTALLLEQRPDNRWLTQVDPSLQPKFAMLYAQLYLKVSEEEKAYPYIEMLSKTHPKQSLDLANEFIRVWTKNHDPNSDRNRSYRYGYMYGYNQRANAIPLTRSKQVRNIKELTEWIAKIRDLPIGDLDEATLTNAFTATHSLAEVYKLNDITSVFGGLDSLKPKTISAFVETMRRNLLTVWRDPRVQDAKKTKRVDKEIQMEVKSGYATAFAVVFDALDEYPDSWELQLNKAAILTDENNFKNDKLEETEGFGTRRAESFKEFEKAAEMYAKALEDLPEDKHSSEVFDVWFYAALGASDLGAIHDSQVPNKGQLALIKAAIEGLPGRAAERHMARFANNLSSRISSVKAELKNLYLKNGLAIAGEHKQAQEAKKLYEYYADLVDEIKLETKLDGPMQVGSEEPFGMFVNISHTKAIERESGGFAKYLQNQNNGYYYNYGRPATDYRDKFEESARGILEEHFDVQSITFHSDKIKSRGVGIEGWRVTPYAYILMKPKDEGVITIPPLKLDFDFLDTSGFAVLPIGSNTISIDASETGPRPITNLKITQTLDEREAKDGKLKLEINASAHGLVPDLKEIVNLKFGDEFELVNTEPLGLSIAKLDAESDENSVVSERSWILEMKARAGLTEAPKTFSFPGPVGEPKEVIYQRYDDADLATAEQTISLEEVYGQGGMPWWSWIAIIAGALLVFLILAIILWPKKEKVAVQQGRYQLPDEVTPFAVITLLRRIRQENNLQADSLGQLDESIHKLEKHYFLAEVGDEPDLRQIAEGWIQKAA